VTALAAGASLPALGRRKTCRSDQVIQWIKDTVSDDHTVKISFTDYGTAHIMISGRWFDSTLMGVVGKRGGFKNWVVYNSLGEKKISDNVSISIQVYAGNKD